MLNTDRENGLYSADAQGGHAGQAPVRLVNLLAQAVAQSGEGICICDTDGVIQYANAALEEMIGYPDQQATGRRFPLDRALGDDAERLAKIVEKIRAGRQWSGRWRLQRIDGQEIVLESTFSPVRDQAGRISHSIGIHHDITREVELSAKLRQAQKLEAVGRLAGGVAHDFNNLITAILGNAQILRMQAEDQQGLVDKLDHIIRASQRAEGLTGKLMRFARHGACERFPLDVHELVSEVAEMFHRHHGRRLTVSMELTAEPSIIQADAVQLRDALRNLGLNACEACADGDTVTFVTRTVRLTEDSPLSDELDIAPGRYLCLSVRDTGRGMDEQTRSHLFEPFFTTKSQTEGAGLGLASVYGCVRGHSGAVRIRSGEGLGTTVDLYLPAGDEEAPAEPVLFESREDEDQAIIESPDVGDAPEAGLIMVVDDEASIREMLTDALEPLGYTVHCFSGGAEAVEFYGRHHREVSMVILDLIMPRMDGRQTFMKLKEIDPDIRALISTGYGTSEMAKRVLADGVLDFMAKPYRLDELAEMVNKYSRKRT